MHRYPEPILLPRHTCSLVCWPPGTCWLRLVDVFPLHIAEVAQPVPKGLPQRGGRRRGWGQDTDPRDFAPRLRRDRERRCEQAQGERDDAPNGVAPHHLLLALPVYPPFACHMNEAERLPSATRPQPGTFSFTQNRHRGRGRCRASLGFYTACGG